jgi:hypothetical protein
MPYVKTGEVSFYKFQPEKPKWPWVVAAALVLVVIVANSGSDEKKDGQSQPPPEPHHVHRTPPDKQSLTDQ